MKKRKFTKFIPRIRSRHPSHNALRGALKFMPFRSVIRFGSTTEIRDLRRVGGDRIEINTPKGIRNSSNKRIMKECFRQGNVKTALWFTYVEGQLRNRITDLNVVKEELPFPLIAKKHFGSKNKNNTKLNNLEEFNEFIKTASLNSVIFEKFYNFNREYRLHVTEDGCFYACRKLMRRGTPEENKWFKNDLNCIWALEANPNFDRPSNWKAVEEECVKALKSLSLDFAAMDLRIQSATDAAGNFREDPDFIVVEANSAPGLARVGIQKYKEMLPKLLIKKASR